jgi:hypothetical protein
LSISHGHIFENLSFPNGHIFENLLKLHNFGWRDYYMRRNRKNKIFVRSR